MKTDLSKISDDELRAEMFRRKEDLTKNVLRKSMCKCSHCGKNSNLKFYTFLDFYYLEDDVYTQNWFSTGNPALICPHCKKHNRTDKEWEYKSLTPRKDDTKALELYKTMKKFQTYGGKHKAYFRQYKRGYGNRDDFYKVSDVWTYPEETDNRVDEKEIYE